MSKTEEFDSFEPFDPFAVEPRPRVSSAQSEAEDPSIDTKPKIKRQLTPVNLQRVEFWHHGEEPKKRKFEKPSVGSAYSRRADQLGVFLLVCALVTLVSVVVMNRLSAKRYVLSIHPAATTTAEVDFYQGNHTFAQTVAQEQAYRHLQDVPQKKETSSTNGFAYTSGLPYPSGLVSSNASLDVPILEQMKSMSEEIKKIRSAKEAGEAPPPAPDNGVKVEYPKVPVAPENFESPNNMNGALPNALQTIK